MKLQITFVRTARTDKNRRELRFPRVATGPATGRYRVAAPYNGTASQRITRDAPGSPGPTPPEPSSGRRPTPSARFTRYLDRRNSVRRVRSPRPPGTEWCCGTGSSRQPSQRNCGCRPKLPQGIGQPLIALMVDTHRRHRPSALLARRRDRKRLGSQGLRRKGPLPAPVRPISVTPGIPGIRRARLPRDRMPGAPGTLLPRTPWARATRLGAAP
jgi:hypothetical protein